MKHDTLWTQELPVDARTAQGVTTMLKQVSESYTATEPAKKRGRPHLLRWEHLCLSIL